MEPSSMYFVQCTTRDTAQEVVMLHERQASQSRKHTYTYTVNIARDLSKLNYMCVQEDMLSPCHSLSLHTHTNTKQLH